MSRLVGKPTICIGENKDADQLRGNREADQRLCFRYSDSTIPLLRNFKILTLFCDCTDRFVSDLFENHIVGFPTRRLVWERCKRMGINGLHFCIQQLNIKTSPLKNEGGTRVSFKTWRPPSG